MDVFFLTFLKTWFFKIKDGNICLNKNLIG